MTMMIGLKWWALIHDEDSRWLASVADIKEYIEELIMLGRKQKRDKPEARAWALVMPW